jgi:hypothetical protein
LRIAISKKHRKKSLLNEKAVNSIKINKMPARVGSSRVEEEKLWSLTALGTNGFETDYGDASL